jgi:hypothetical protein
VGMKGLKQFAHIKQVQQGMEPDDFCNWQKWQEMSTLQLIIRAIDHTMDVLGENHGKGTCINLGSRWM